MAAVLALTRSFQTYLTTCPLDPAAYPSYVSPTAQAVVFGPVCPPGQCCNRVLSLRDYVFMTYPQYCTDQVTIVYVAQQPCAVKIVDCRTAIVTMTEIVNTTPPTVNQVQYTWTRQMGCTFLLTQVESDQLQGQCQGIQCPCPTRWKRGSSSAAAAV